MATRTHRDKSNNVRSLIMNNRSHEVLVLDGESSMLWEMLVKANAPQNCKIMLVVKVSVPWSLINSSQNY